MVREAEWKYTMVQLNVDQMVNKLENTKKKMDAIEESAINWKLSADVLNNYNEALQHWQKYIRLLIDRQRRSVLI